MCRQSEFSFKETGFAGVLMGAAHGKIEAY